MASHTDTIPAAGSPAKAATLRAHGRGKRERPNPLLGLSHVALVLWALLVIIPIVWTFLAAFKDNTEIFGDPWTLPHHWGTASWTRAWGKANIGRYMINTVF